jgi:hypothetical protein
MADGTTIDSVSCQTSSQVEVKEVCGHNKS